MSLRPGEETLRSGGNWLVGDDYYNLTNGYKTSFFRLQVQPVYKVGWEQEEFRRFLETGERVVQTDGPWLNDLRDKVRSGRTPHRVYVISPPLTDYQRYVFIGYHHYAKAGEDLRIIDVSRTVNPGLPNYDFILLDDEIVIKLHYEDDGIYIGRELLPSADPAKYTRYKELAMNHSIPFLKYEELIAG